MPNWSHLKGNTWQQKHQSEKKEVRRSARYVLSEREGEENTVRKWGMIKDLLARSRRRHPPPNTRKDREREARSLSLPVRRRPRVIAQRGGGGGGLWDSVGPSTSRKKGRKGRWPLGGGGGEWGIKGRPRGTVGEGG